MSSPSGLDHSTDAELSFKPKLLALSWGFGRGSSKRVVVVVAAATVDRLVGSEDRLGSMFS